MSMFLAAAAQAMVAATGTPSSTPPPARPASLQQAFEAAGALDANGPPAARAAA